MPFSKTGVKTGFLKKKKGTKMERKRGENRISGSKIQFKTGKGTRNRKRRPELETGKAPVFLGTNPEQKTERKRSENGITGSRKKWQSEKGNRNKNRVAIFRNRGQNGIFEEKKRNKTGTKKR